MHNSKKTSPPQKNQNPQNKVCMVPDTFIIQNYQKRSHLLHYLPLLRLKLISSFKTPRMWPWLEGQWNSIVSAVGVSGCAVWFWANQDLSPSSGFHQFRQIIHSLLLRYSSIKLGSLFCSFVLREELGKYFKMIIAPGTATHQ